MRGQQASFDYEIFEVNDFEGNKKLTIRARSKSGIVLAERRLTQAERSSFDKRPSFVDGIISDLVNVILDEKTKKLHQLHQSNVQRLSHKTRITDDLPIDKSDYQDYGYYGNNVQNIETDQYLKQDN